MNNIEQLENVYDKFNDTRFILNLANEKKAFYVDKREGERCSKWLFAKGLSKREVQLENMRILKECETMFDDEANEIFGMDEDEFYYLSCIWRYENCHYALICYYKYDCDEMDYEKNRMEISWWHDDLDQW